MAMTYLMGYAEKGTKVPDILETRSLSWGSSLPDLTAEGFESTSVGLF